VKEEIIGTGSPTTPLNAAALELLRVKNHEADEWHSRWQTWAGMYPEFSALIFFSQTFEQRK